MDGKENFEFAILIDGSWVHARSLDGSKVFSPNEAEARTILRPLKPEGNFLAGIP